MNRVLLSFPEQFQLGQSLAPALQARHAEVTLHRFPDGESLVRIDPDLRDADVAILASLDHPDAIALPLRFAAETAREFGARSIGLIAPYLGYMRQDARFHPGEAISAPLFARFLEGSFDWLVTVDPHLHRVPALDELFAIPVRNVAAAPAIAAWIRKNLPNAVVVGPDSESRQWADGIARGAGVPSVVLDKIRRGDREVAITAPDLSAARGRTPVLIDDIVSTGNTMAAAVMHLRSMGLAPATCLATHAVFAQGARELLMEAGAHRVVSTDTIPHETNAIPIAPLLAAAGNRMFENAGTDIDAEDPATVERWFVEDEPPP